MFNFAAHTFTNLLKTSAYSWISELATHIITFRNNVLCLTRWYITIACDISKNQPKRVRYFRLICSDRCKTGQIQWKDKTHIKSHPPIKRCRLLKLLLGKQAIYFDTVCECDVWHYEDGRSKCCLVHSQTKFVNVWLFGILSPR